MQPLQHSLRSNPWAWLPPAIALLLFVIIYLTGSNRSLFMMLNHSGHAAGNIYWSNLTILGDGAVALALILPSIRRSPHRFWAALIAAVIAALWVQICKNAINVPRPLSVFPSAQFFHAGPEYRAVSFPSGHATAISALAGIWVISLAKHYVLRFLILTLAILVSASRIMTGVHWPLDVLAGMAGGWLSAYAGLLIAERWRWKTCGIGGYIAGAVLLMVSASLLVSDHMGFPSALTLQRALGAVCLACGAWEIAWMLRRRRLDVNVRRE